MQEPIALGYRLRLLGLAQGFEALGTHRYALLLTIDREAGPLDVDVPTALGVAHGVADVVSKLRPTAANLALGHGNTSLANENPGAQRLGAESRLNERYVSIAYSNLQTGA
jgi:hypothetical protein